MFEDLIIELIFFYLYLMNNVLRKYVESEF